MQCVDEVNFNVKSSAKQLADVTTFLTSLGSSPQTVQLISHFPRLCLGKVKVEEPVPFALGAISGMQNDWALTQIYRPFIQLALRHQSHCSCESL